MAIQHTRAKQALRMQNHPPRSRVPLCERNALVVIHNVFSTRAGSSEASPEKHSPQASTPLSQNYRALLQRVNGVVKE